MKYTPTTLLLLLTLMVLAPVLLLGGRSSRDRYVRLSNLGSPEYSCHNPFDSAARPGIYDMAHEAARPS